MTNASRDPRQRYEICVHGHLGDTIRSAFPDLQARERGGNTTLSGVFADQAALYGVLAQIEGLGLELIELRRLPIQAQALTRPAPANRTDSANDESP
jgi:hypothetical protein